MAYNSIIETLQKEQEKANQANLTRYQDILKLSDEIAGIYAPGGAFGKGFEAQLDRVKKQTVASGMQQLVSSGLSNTTNAAGLGQQFEENVGAPSRLRLEDLRMDRYSNALGAKQGFMERRTDSGPDYGAIAQYANQVGQAPGRVRGMDEPYTPLPSLPRTYPYKPPPTQITHQPQTSAQQAARQAKVDVAQNIRASGTPLNTTYYGSGSSYDASKSTSKGSFGPKKYIG